MLCAGLYDGNIAVYNLQTSSTNPSYQSDAATGKHREAVWQVHITSHLDYNNFNHNYQIKWGPDNLDGYLNLYSVSGDGRVSNWTLVKTALLCNDTLNIEFTKVLENTGDDDIPEGLTGTNQSTMCERNSIGV